jgi:hypothetical protein
MSSDANNKNSYAIMSLIDENKEEIPEVSVTPPVIPRKRSIQILDDLEWYFNLSKSEVKKYERHLKDLKRDRYNVFPDLDNDELISLYRFKAVISRRRKKWLNFRRKRTIYFKE